MCVSVCACRFLGVLVVFVCGALLSYVLSFVILHCRPRQHTAEKQKKGGYELVDEGKTADDAKPTEKELKT